MTKEDAIYWIKNLAVLATEKDMLQIEEALNMAIEALADRKTEPQIDDFFREPTAEERKAVAEYIESISIPTGVNVFDLMDEQTERSE